MADLGVDIRVLPDLDEDEGLVEGIDCMAQDLLLRLDNPTGLADGTDEGAVWGYDLAGNLGDSLTQQGLLAIVVDCELQCEADDRVASVKADSAFDENTQALTLRLDIDAGAGPFALTIHVSPDTLPILILQQAGVDA